MRSDRSTSSNVRCSMSTVSPRYSVVVTCYNLGAFLEEAIASIPNDPEVEIIVVDDGSTEPRTVEVIERLPAHVRLIRQSNQGLAQARNNGIEAALGDFIIPLDADNRLRSEMVDEARRVFRDHPEMEVVYGDAEYFGARAGRWELGPSDLVDLIVRNRIDACAAFKRSLWERLGGYDRSMPVMGFEDWDFWLRAVVAGAQFYRSDHILFEYRVREDSMIGTTMQHRDRLVAYIFQKPELRFLSDLRTEYLWFVTREREARILTGRHLLAMLVQRIAQRFESTDKLESFIMLKNKH